MLEGQIKMRCSHHLSWSLFIHRVFFSAGAYSCEASVPGFPPVSQSARVRLRGPPIILQEHGTQFR